MEQSRRAWIRFLKEVQKKYMEEWIKTHFKSYNAVMRGYVLVPDAMREGLDELAKYLEDSYDYVMTLDPK